MLVAGALGAVVLTLPACTSSKPTSSGAGESSSGAPATSEAAATTVAAPAKASKNYNIQFLQGVAGDQFYITMQCGAQDEADDELDDLDIPVALLDDEPVEDEQHAVL